MKAEVEGTITKWHWGEWIRDSNPLNKWIRIKIVDKLNITGVSYVP
jgi:hypothetical protein